jgi:uncharacterized protein YjbI with pentapeptide repeats
MVFHVWAERIKSLANVTWSKAKAFWAALTVRGWPTRVPEFLENPPRWFVLLFFALATLIVVRAVYLIGFGGAEEVNKFLVGIAAFVGAPFLVWRTWIADRQRHVAQEELYTGLLVKAVEQLGATREEKTEDGKVKTVPNTEVRLGAIYALEKLARDYELLHWPIMEILCAYVRQNAGQLNPRTDEFRTILEKSANARTESEKEILTAQAELRLPFVDVQTALTVVGRRSEKQREWEKQKYDEADGVGKNAFRFDLSNCHLAEANMAGLQFERVILDGSCLEGAKFYEAHLEGASLFAAHLERAHLLSAHLEGANFRKARLESAWFEKAHLDGAWFIETHLERANLKQAHLERAHLNCAHLEGAWLHQAYLEGAYLGSATGVTQKQLDEAFGDENTGIPDGLTRPAHWTKSAAGRGEGA